MTYNLNLKLEHHIIRGMDRIEQSFVESVIIDPKYLGLYTTKIARDISLEIPRGIFMLIFKLGSICHLQNLYIQRHSSFYFLFFGMVMTQASLCEIFLLSKCDLVR